jgi:hypothetical protein
MKGMIFKKAFLLGGIFLLATFMLAQSSWGCDDDDKRDRDCHDKWHCDHHGNPCQPPKIQRVFLDYGADSIVFEIWGKNFANGALPVVTLGGVFDLTVDDALTNDNVITATLSSIAEKKFEFGDYRLVVSTCHNSACEDKYCKDHGPNCKCKYCRDHCSKCKDKNCKDYACKCRCKDRYSLTIAGPPVPPGAPGTIESAVFEKVGDFDNITNPKKISGTATCGEGYTVTGGGFKQTNLRIMESRAEGNGWYVLGRIVFEIEADFTLTIYAVCAKIK